MQAVRLSERYTVGAQIRADDVGDIQAAGYRVVICNRPDGEDAGQPPASEIAAACRAAGLEFHHLPIKGADLPPEVVDALRNVLDHAGGPVFAYCRSGQRSAYLWARAGGGAQGDPG